jgi:hypothetical protein
LYPKFVGPFQITEVVNDTSYRLELPKSMPIHDVFHTSLLKEYIPSRMAKPPPVPIEVDGELEYEVSRILTHREKKCRSSKSGGMNIKKEYLIEWLGYGAEHNTWEQEGNLTNCSEILKEYWADQSKRQAQNLLRANRPRQVAKRKQQPEAPADVGLNPSKRSRK